MKKLRRYRKQDYKERFWKRVQKTNYCWIWKGSDTGHGYGTFHFKGKAYVAHRFSWLLKYGTFTKNLTLHKCNNRRCVNPDHLYDGTAKDNTGDIIKAGKYNFINSGTLKSGEENRQAKLNDEIVRSIRKEYIPKVVTQKMLAERYHIAKTTVREVLIRKSWKHI